MWGGVASWREEGGPPEETGSSAPPQLEELQRKVSHFSQTLECSLQLVYYQEIHRQEMQRTNVCWRGLFFRTY